MQKLQPSSAFPQIGRDLEKPRRIKQNYHWLELLPDCPIIKFKNDFHYSSLQVCFAIGEKDRDYY